MDPYFTMNKRHCFHKQIHMKSASFKSTLQANGKKRQCMPVIAGVMYNVYITRGDANCIYLSLCNQSVSSAQSTYLLSTKTQRQCNEKNVDLLIIPWRGKGRKKGEARRKGLMNVRQSDIGQRVCVCAGIERMFASASVRLLIT